jgi:hypothetical protein
MNFSSVKDAQVLREIEILQGLDYSGLVKGFEIGLRNIRINCDSDGIDGWCAGRGEAVRDFEVNCLDVRRDARGIAHIDVNVSPANILMKGGRAKLGDFGSAKLYDLSITQTSMGLTQG